MSSAPSVASRTLGEFALREKLAEGGFGTVYRAEQHTLGRSAVVKVMRPSLAVRRDAIERFTREARLASHFDHPYAAHVYAFGTEPDGLLWIAMEMVRGTPLDEMLVRSGPLPLDRFVPLMERLCEVVQAAHDQGIVHRDIKPSNVMVLSRSGRLIPKLLDFGIAKLFEIDADADDPRAASAASLQPTRDDRPAAASLRPAWPGDRQAETRTSETLGIGHGDLVARVSPGAISTAQPGPAVAPGGTLSVDHTGVPAARPRPAGLTHEGQILGSPPYMAPEQWLDPSRVGPRTDQYALAMLAYEVLSGARPYLATSAEGLAACHLHTPLPALPGHLPAAVHAVLARAAAKDPEQRYGSLDDLSAALRAAVGPADELEERVELPGEMAALWVADAPRPIAEAVAALAVARTSARIADRALAVASLLAHWLGVLAIACRSHAGKLAADRDELELLRALRRRPLRDEEWLDLAAALTRPFADRPETWPVPELVRLFAGPGAITGAGAGAAAGAAVAELRALASGTSQPVAAGAAEADPDRRLARHRVGQLARLLGELAWLLDYGVAREVPEGLELWMGMRTDDAAIRRAEGADAGRGGEAAGAAGAAAAGAAGGRVILLDADGARAAVMSPVMQVLAPAQGEPLELFLLRGPGRALDAARFVASPRGFERELDELWPWLAGGVLEAIPAAAGGDRDERPPYPGLAAFTAGDCASFVGRERDVEDAINRLRAQRAIAVVGASGVGKSSFLAAGLIPALPARWSAELIRPGHDPLAALAALVERAGERLYREQLRDESSAPRDLAAELVAIAERRDALVIIVDQAEELFTMCSDDAGRAAFARILAAAAGSARIRLVVGVRDDFWCRLDELDAWRGMLGRSVQILRMPGAAELERIVTVPARRRGYDFDDAELPRRIAAEVADRPGALSLLAFAAAELWQRRDVQFQRLTRSAYDAIGGVVGALVQHADGVVDAMPAADQRLVRLAFGRLLTAAGTRTSIGRGELIAALAAPAAARVIERLIDARLIVSRDDATGDAVEIVHEALATMWPRLAAWQRADAADGQLHEQLATAARHWDERGRPAGLLWRGEAVDDLLRWRARSPLSLTPVEAAFAAASEAAVHQARRRRRRALAAAFAALGVALAVLGWLDHRIARQRAEAIDQVAAGLAERGRLAVLDDDALHGLLYLSEARRLGRDDAAIDLLTARAAASLDSQSDVLARGLGAISRIELDSSTIVTVGGGTAQVWDRARGAAVGAPFDNILDAALAGDSVLLLSRTGELSMFDRRGGLRWKIDHAASPGPEAPWAEVAVHAAAGLAVTFGVAAQVRRIDDGAPVAVLRSGAPIKTAAFDRAGHRVATGDSAGEVRVWDLPSGALLATCTGHTDLIEQLAFSAAGDLLVSASDDRDIRICDPATGAPIRRLQGHSNWVTAIDLSADGQAIASGSADGTARLWSVRTGALIATLSSHHGAVASAVFSPDGREVATAHADGTAQIWDTAGIALASLEGHAGRLKNVLWEADGRHLITAGFDGSVRRWDATRAVRASSDQRHAAAIADVTVSGDGRWAVTGDVEGTIVVWDLGTGAARTVLHSAQPIAVVELAHGGDELASTDRSGTVSLWSIPDGALIQTLDQHAVCAGFTPDGQRLVTSGRDQVVRLWSRTGQPIAAIAIDSATRRLEFDPRGRWAITLPAYNAAATDATVIDLTSARVVARLHGEHTGFAINVDPDRVAIADGSKIRIWELGTWKPLATLTGHTSNILNLVFLPDGRIVTTGGDLRVLVWSRSYALVASLPVGGTGVINLQMSSDGSLLVTDGSDGAARVWDMTSYRELLTLPSHHEALRHMRLTPDGQRLLTAGADGRVVTWDLRRPVRTQAELDRLVRCRVPLRLDGDVALPRELDLDDPSCR